VYKGHSGSPRENSQSATPPVEGELLPGGQINFASPFFHLSFFRCLNGGVLDYLENFLWGLVAIHPFFLPGAGWAAKGGNHQAFIRFHLLTRVPLPPIWAVSVGQLPLSLKDGQLSTTPNTPASHGAIFFLRKSFPGGPF